MKPNSIKTSDISFNRVTEFYLQELRKGHAPSIDVFAKAFPHLSEEIKTELPAIVMLEKTVGANKASKKAPAESETQLDGCVIDKEIGRGAMGVVYRAYQQDLKRIVAVKVINVHGADTSIIAHRFELERHAMARLDHPNIVPVYSCGHNDKAAYLVMKCIDGHSLLDLQNGAGDYRVQAMFAQLRSDWSLIARLGADVASGLHHSHEQGLIHRDIKPANLLIDNAGKVWITDYGLAKVYDYARSLSGTGDAIGTPRYMAPEQIRGICDPRSDIYSLGITLYELATHEKPWDDATLTSLIAKRASLDLVDVRSKNPDVPDSLAKIIMKACAFSPEDRYQTGLELQIVLERFLAGITPSDRRKRRREPDEVFRRRSRRNLAIASICSVLGIAGSMIAVHALSSAPAANPQVASVAPKARLASTNLLEKLTEGNQEDVGSAVRDFFRQSVTEAGEEFHLAEQEKAEILNQWDEVSEKIKRAKMDEKSMKQFTQKLQTSTIPIGTKIASIVRLVDRSSFPPAEKNAAHHLLRNFAKAAIHRSIPEKEAVALLARLTGGRVLSSEELLQVTVPDNQLRNWLGAVQQRVTKVPAETLNSLNLQAEVDSAIQQAFDSKY